MRADARLQREGASAPPEPTPRKSKNKTFLSKEGCVRLLCQPIRMRFFPTECLCEASTDIR